MIDIAPIQVVVAQLPLSDVFQPAARELSQQANSTQVRRAGYGTRAVELKRLAHLGTGAREHGQSPVRPGIAAAQKYTDGATEGFTARAVVTTSIARAGLTWHLVQIVTNRQ